MSRHTLGTITGRKSNMRRIKSSSVCSKNDEGNSSLVVDGMMVESTVSAGME